jgi:3-dehydroquinate dehydratase/shikimate dehydrogenase
VQVSDPRNKVAVAVSGASTADCLAKIESVASLVSFAEVRLDLMESFDLVSLISGSPVPVIITYRPVREGGRYDGDESLRLDVLRDAAASGAAYIDVEVDSLDVLGAVDCPVIASHHSFDSMPVDLAQQYTSLRDRCDVVKLVGTASSVRDTLVVFELLRDATTPVITMAMGEAGLATRLLAPAFESCVLTYGAVNDAEATAPGQVSVQTMVNSFGLDALGPATPLRFAAGDAWGATWNGGSLTLEFPSGDELAGVLRIAFPAATFD